MHILTWYESWFMMSMCASCLAKAIYELVFVPCIWTCNQTHNRNTHSQLVALLDIVLYMKHGQHTCIAFTKFLVYAQHLLSFLYVYLLL